MARKPALSLEALSKLGIEKLARIVLDETARNAPFRKIVNAALAGIKGPEAIAKIVDRRLGALERATGFIDWEKVRAFRDDLQATVVAISGELGPASAPMAMDRLLRFIATEEAVEGRIDDSSGRIARVYSDAVDKMGELAGKLETNEAALLPERIMAALADTSYEHLPSIAAAMARQLPDEVLVRWDQILNQLQREEEETDKGGKEMQLFSRTWELRSARQAIASARGDIDSLVRLESEKHPNLQDAMGMARRLLDAGRAEEALEWVRKSRATPSVNGGYARPVASLAEPAPPRISLEAEILTKLSQKDAAQALRWNAFEETLNAGVLRDYVRALSDFEEFEVLDRAFAHASSAGRPGSALALFLDWPRVDLAAKLVIEDRNNWNGRHYSLLAPSAQLLEEMHPLAATLLYRVLLDDILADGNSQAYPIAASYLGKLDLLAPRADVDPARTATIVSHATYKATVQKAHGRKYGFWRHVDSGAPNR